MGSSTLYQLAKRGVRVLGIDRFDPPHEYGSSHGQTRTIREAYFEHPDYIPLIQRAYELWSELESASSEKLFSQTGCLMMGQPDSTVVTGAKESADTHTLPYDWLTADQIRTQYPIFNISDETVAVREPRAGILLPEKCIASYLKLARQQGAEIRTNIEVTSWNLSSGKYSVVTASGRFTADQLVVSAGAWVGRLLPDLSHLFNVDRQLLFWFEPAEAPENLSKGRLPIFILEYQPDRFIYGFPDSGDGFKVARHYQGTTCDPDKIDRSVHQHEINEILEILRSYIPSSAGELCSTAVCMYTNTPDLHFVIDEHPQYPGLWVVSPCSGHGFKLASVIGEVVAQQVTSEKISFDLSLFKLSRFKNLESTND